MKLSMVIGALVVCASLCGQSFGSNLNCGGGHCNKCCKPAFSGLKSFFDCHFPCGPALVIKPITWHRHCRS